jgi:pimeloyl-ACP methyl ester carboxylesterase
MPSSNSTNGRAIPVALRVQRTLLRTLAAVAPGAAERRVVDLFATPRRGRGSLADPAPQYVDAAGYRLAVYGRGPGAPVLLAHGWEGSADDLAPVGDALAAAGFRAVAFDMPAHGRSGGRRATLRDMALAVRGVADRLGPLAAVVAHSLGATAALLALRDGLAARAAVLVAPPREPGPYLRGFTRALGLGARHDAGVRREIERRVGPFERFDAGAAARALALPGLVLHDVADRQVPFADGVAVSAAWAGSELRAVEGLGHRRLLRDPRVVDDVVRFVLAHGAGAPAAAPERVAGARDLGLSARREGAPA